MLKTIVKLLLAAIIYAVLFSAANALLPFSPGFKELEIADPLTTLVFIFLNSIWICFTAFFIIKHSQISGFKLFFNLLFVIFFVQSFMTQIETLFFFDAFPVLIIPDIILIMVAAFIPLAAVIPLLIKFFHMKNSTTENITIENQPLNIKKILIKLGIIGIIYLFVYLLFGYFVAWQIEELRFFYSGSKEKLGFLGQMLNNLNTYPAIIPFQIFRGILFAAFIIPLLNMTGKNKRVFITCVSLVYLSTAVMLIIPNALFPDTVRFGHLIEMTTSMLVFGIITGNIMAEK